MSEKSWHTARLRSSADTALNAECFYTRHDTDMVSTRHGLYRKLFEVIRKPVWHGKSQRIINPFTFLTRRLKWKNTMPKLNKSLVLAMQNCPDRLFCRMSFLVLNMNWSRNCRHIFVSESMKTRRSRFHFLLATLASKTPNHLSRKSRHPDKEGTYLYERKKYRNKVVCLAKYRLMNFTSLFLWL